MVYYLNKNRVLSCGSVVHENIIKNNTFKPKYYILIEYDQELQHYELIKYKMNDIFYIILFLKSSFETFNL